MAIRVMLPEAQDPTYDWGQQKKFFSLNVTDIHVNLASEEHLAPEGIASPWAQVFFLEWILRNQQSNKGREAVEVLQLVVLLQFLGYLDADLVSLGDIGYLGPLLARSWPERVIPPLLIWKIKGLGPEWDGQIFAGSLPQVPFFPGAIFYPDLPHVTLEPGKNYVPCWRKVQEVLVTQHRPGTTLPLLDEQGEVADPYLAATLSEYLKTFIKLAPTRGWGIALEAWRNRLLALLAKHQYVQPPSIAWSDVTLEYQGAPGAEEAVRYGTYPIGGPPGRLWICPTCGGDWINTSGQQAVASSNLGVFCREHRIPIRTAGGQEVGPADYGTYPAPDGRLYVWTDKEACPPGCTESRVEGRLGSEGTVTYRFNRQLLEVRGHLVSLDNVLLKTTAWMSRQNEDPTPVDIPVPGEYAALVEKCSPDPLNRQWEITFHGLPKPLKVPYPAHQDQLWNTSTVVVWPPEDLAGWTIDYAAATTPRGDRARFRLVEERGDGAVVPSSQLIRDALYRTEAGKVRYFEVGETLPDGSFRSMGLLKVNRPTISNAGNSGCGEIVLDFGTSNSAVLFYWPGDIRRFVRSGVREAGLQSSAYFLTYRQTEFNNLLRAVAILSRWNPDNSPQPFLPSLVADSDKMAQGSSRCIPPRERGLSLLTGPQSRVKSGLKWKDWTAPGIVDRIKSLIELLLLPAFWELCRHGCSSVRLMAAYPLAFDELRKGIYRRILDEVAGSLSRRTGLQIEKEGGQSVLLVSESAAGSALLPKTQVTHEVALDMGGGTTDLAVQVGAAGRDLVGQDVGTILAADSIEYAGRDFLHAIVTVYGPEVLRKILSSRPLDLLPGHIDPPDPRAFVGEPSLLADAYIDCLEAVLHRCGPQGLQSLLTHTPDGWTSAEIALKRQDVKSRWEALLGGLLFYVRRVVEACLSEMPEGQPQEVQFNLLGQGWELLHLLGPDINQPVNLVLAPRLNALCADIARSRGSNCSCRVLTMPSIQNPKTAVVEGGDRIRQLQSDMLKKKDEVSGALFNPMAANTRKTFVGMTIFDQHNQPVIQWNTKLSDAIRRPSWPGDPGYRRLLDELFEAISGVAQTTDVSSRTLVKERLFNSGAYRRQYATQDVWGHLISRGQDDLNRETWLPASPFPTRSLLAGFLTSVWRPTWAAMEL